MRKIFLALVWLAAAALPARAADLVLNVTLDYDQERNHLAIKSVFNDFAAYLGGALKTPVRLVMTQNAERVGERIRFNSYDMLLAPAQLIGLAMRHGYTPVAATEERARIVLVARSAAEIKDFNQTRGKSLALPHPESLISYMLKGEMNALGLSPRSYFSRVTHVNGYEAALYAMEIDQADVVALKEASAKSWLSAHKGAAQIKAFPEIPLAGIAVANKLDAGLRDRIRAALTRIDPALEKRLAKVGFGALEPADTADFEYVSTRGFFTPEVLSGAVIVDAKQVADLMAKGVPLFDVRPNSHYREGHIPKAVNVTYEMNSPKETEYDAAVDKFDIGKLPKDKNAPIIFQCNGAECWYSYKAARYMVKLGYKRIYWFRTGLPAWKAAGFQIEK